MSYKKLQIWQEARELSILIHEMTLRLPKHEQFEEGQQIRRSIKSVRSNIVEGYGRRTYKQDFVRFIVIAQASNDETIDHLETLFETKSLHNEVEFNQLRQKLDILGRKLNNFLKALVREHNSKNNAEEPSIEYLNLSTSALPESSDEDPVSKDQDPESSDQDPVSGYRDSNKAGDYLEPND